MRLPSYPWRFAHLAALWAYGVSQAVFSMLKGNPEFLVVRGSTRADVALFALLLVVMPALIVVALEAATGVISRTLSNAFHVVAIWSFAWLAALQLTRLLRPEGGATLLLPIVPATLAALAYVRWSPFRSFLSLSLALPVIGTLVFVATVPLAVDDASGANVRVASTTPVVLVVFDEFPLSSLLRPNGAIDEVRYPNFARLAREATWYPHATSVHASTTQAVPAILTGLIPGRGQLPTLEDHPQNLFTLLGERYRIRASEQATRLCPSRYCPRTRKPLPLVDRQRGLFYDVSVGFLYRVLPSSLRGGLPTIGERWGGFGEGSEVDVRERVLGALDTNAWEDALDAAWGRKREQFAGFVESIDGDPRRTLYFEHALLPHSPSAYLPSGRAYGNPSTVEGIEDDWVRWRSSEFLVEQALQRHLLQVGFTDRLLGQLVERLHAVGLYDRALVVVTADHGASFRAGGLFREPSPANLADIASIPLLVKFPEQHRGRLDPRNAKTIDVLPTIADVVGVRIPWKVDGRSLRAAPTDGPVAVRGFEDETVVGDPDAVADSVLATARRNAALFGTGTDSLYRVGPYRKLLSRRVRSLVSSIATGARIDLEDEIQFANVRSDSAFVPARIVGEIEGTSLPVGSPIAVAVDDRVVATTWSFESGHGHRFAVMVPENSFHDGRNIVTVFAILQGPEGVRLAHLGGTHRPPVRQASGGGAMG